MEKNNLKTTIGCTDLRQRSKNENVLHTVKKYVGDFSTSSKRLDNNKSSEITQEGVS